MVVARKLLHMLKGACSMSKKKTIGRREERGGRREEGGERMEERGGRKNSLAAGFCTFF